MIKKILSRTYIAFIFLFLYAPIAILIFFSFNKARGRGVFTGFTFEWYERLFSNNLILTSFFNTIIVAAVSSVLATIIGTMAAIGISSFNKKMKSAIMGVTYISIINPEIVTGVSLMLLFVIMKLKFGFTTLILAHITFNIPYVILNVLPKLRQQDSSLYEAALDLGCTPTLAFWKVVIPDIFPGIIAGFLMALTYSLDDFVVSYFTSGITSQTLPITIYSMTRKRVSPEINAISTVIFTIVLITLVVINIKEIKKEKYLTQLKRKFNKNN
ncbi:ABC transporter permease [Brachyspira pilosicoli]|uniref:ABC transporter permease n=1 Tax=Brachyspira pilosicoli TaxID=52584 RepID=UPI000E12EB8A|nr:ABC transporter permease [Brachyspira pilosicoli]SUW08541.1 spermidine/putrescine transport transport ATP-binding protein PotC [Brachyspira pilosicoli]